VPTSIAQRHGLFYVGNLNLFPIDPQWARILTIAKEHPLDEEVAAGFEQDYGGYHIADSKAGFTTVVAVKFGPQDGLLYALELSDAAAEGPTPGAGKVVRVLRNGQIEEVITGLVVPTGMTFDSEGRLYISNLGAAGGNAGQILRYDITPGL
jgi:hypothetical protein